MMDRLWLHSRIPATAGGTPLQGTPMARTSADTIISGLPHTNGMPPPDRKPGPARRSDRFLGGLAAAERVVFLSHIHPDPDSLGSMLGLAHLVESRLGKPCVLTQDGCVGRAENRAMIDLLQLELQPIEGFTFRPGDMAVMVDSQPGTGRHTCGKPANLYAVVDHHVTPGDLNAVPFIDLRPDVGATCTLVTRYLMEQRVEIPVKVATALMYGIETELSGFPRDGSAIDDDAIGILYPLADKDLLSQIRYARLPRSHFECLALALQNAVLLDRVTFTWVDPMQLPEQAAEVVDFLVRCEQVDWALCAGVYGRQLILSVRSAQPHARAGELLREVVGNWGNAGGHERRAGGCITLTDLSPTAIQKVRKEILDRIRKVFGVEQASTQQLVSGPKLTGI